MVAREKLKLSPSEVQTFCWELNYCFVPGRFLSLTNSDHCTTPYTRCRRPEGHGKRSTRRVGQADVDQTRGWYTCGLLSHEQPKDGNENEQNSGTIGCIEAGFTYHIGVARENLEGGVNNMRFVVFYAFRTC